MICDCHLRPGVCMPWCENYETCRGEDVRTAIIEECARVAESVKTRTGGYAVELVVAAIRALKDKP